MAVLLADVVNGTEIAVSVPSGETTVRETVSPETSPATSNSTVWTLAGVGRRATRIRGGRGLWDRTAAAIL